MDSPLTREQELEEYIHNHRHSEVGIFVRELLALRREKYRDKLEGANSDELRGRAKECKDMLNILVDN